MNIRFDSIKICNFLSIGDASLSLNDCGYAIVEGINRNTDDNAYSNGSGKSSIFEALCWVLTGETVRGIKSVSNINSDDGAFVELSFSMDGIDWRIIRTKDHSKYKTTLKLYRNGEDISGKGIRDTEKILNEYLPDLTSSLIGSVIVLGQGLPQRFTNNSPSGRKDVLERLSKSDFMIEDLKNRISNRKLELSSKLKNVENERIELETTLKMLLSYIERRRKEYDDFQEDVANLEDVGLLKEQLEGVESSLQMNEAVEESIEVDINKLREQKVSKESSITKIVREISQEESSILDEINEYKAGQYIGLSKEDSDIRARAEQLSAEIKKIDSIIDVCPTCGQKIVGVEKPDSSKLREELFTLKSKRKDVHAKMADVDEKCSNLISIARSNSSKKIRDAEKSIRSEIDRLCTDINDLSDRLRAIREIINEKRGDKLRLETSIAKNTIIKQTLEEREKSYREDMASYNEKIKDTNRKILYNKTISDELSERISVISKFNTIVSRDFRGYLLSNTIGFIDERAKEYSMGLFETDKIEFVLNGNNVDISYCGKQYESLSGGEKQKVDIIVQFSIRDMLCKMLGFSCNVLIVDEIFDNLDYIGCQKVVDLISNKLSDISSIFIVTHRNDLEIPCDSRIVVEKNEQGVSSVNVLLH